MIEDSPLEEFGEVVDRIYAAALDPTVWPAPVEGIARLHRAPKANFLTPMSAPTQGGFIFPYGLDPAALETWDAKYREDDVWFQAASRRGLLAPGRVLLNADIMTGDRSGDIHSHCRCQALYGRRRPSRLGWSAATVIAALGADPGQRILTTRASCGGDRILDRSRRALAARCIDAGHVYGLTPAECALAVKLQYVVCVHSD